ncbi:type II toxin-antitoxin system VapC family toxin [Sphaerimonospora thailandensis]|uniref:Ribonuclease VapC n=1 Tax=Sphaerimonospora thailandensis TaxID=795644 RepID=A0A8J3VZS7_9ACTN|nr:type II toxin-antitoxin system VapC family toxin [Sphaerimonospora thailandensis]GIH70171.1 ribonuclease VapC [Sphaerimonospora thailandensis]
MIVIDTTVVSELMRPAPAPTVVQWIRSQTGRDLYTTSITLAEIRYGIERLPDGRRKKLLAVTAEEVFDAFADKVLPFNAPAAPLYAAVVSARERAGTPIDGFDAQIAAICRAHRATLATRNLKDFYDTGIETIDPWGQS